MLRNFDDTLEKFMNRASTISFARRIAMIICAPQVHTSDDEWWRETIQLQDSANLRSYRALSIHLTGPNGPGAVQRTVGHQLRTTRQNLGTALILDFLATEDIAVANLQRPSDISMPTNEDYLCIKSSRSNKPFLTDSSMS